MKRNISDLLDDIREDEVSLELNAPLSAQRIKKNTMRHVQKKKTIGLRWFTRVAAVAAVIAALGITAFAAGAVIGEGKLFGSFFGKPLTEEQVETVGKTFEGGVTSNGTTITPIAMIADDKVCYLHIRVEAREGKVLKDYPDKKPRYAFGCSTGAVENDYETPPWGRTVFPQVTALQDDDPTDNVKEFVLEFKDGNYVRGGTLLIRGLWVENWDDDGWYRMNIFRGDFMIDMDMEVDESKLEIDTGGVSFYNEEFDFTTTVNKLTLTPLSLHIDYTATTPNSDDIIPTGGDIEIVMKDGSSMTVRDYSLWSKAVHDGYISKSEFMEFYGTEVLGAGDSAIYPKPVVLEDIDYIVLNGENTVDVN